MYTGTLIEELMATVERAEQQTRVETADLERWYARVPYEMATVETKLIGVA